MGPRFEYRVEFLQIYDLRYMLKCMDSDGWDLAFVTADGAGQVVCIFKRPMTSEEKSDREYTRE
jgi:hypothetical protein